MDATRIITAQRQIILSGVGATRTRRLIATRPRLMFKSVAHPGIERTPLTLATAHAMPRPLLRRTERGQHLSDTSTRLRISRRQD